MSHRSQISNFPAAMATLLLVCGCHQAAKHQLSAIAHFDQGTPIAAVEAFDQATKSRGAESEIIAIDRSIAMLMAGDIQGCESSLREARDQMDYLRQTDLGERTRAVISDDKAIAWSGREFEQRMVDNLLILSSLLGNHQDAQAYANQAIERVFEDQQSLVEATPAPSNVTTVSHSAQPVAPVQPPARLAANSLSAYLHAAVRSENPMDHGVTTAAIRQIGYWNQTHSPIDPSRQVAAETFGTLSPKGHGVVHVITFVGRVTDWSAERALPTTSALLIADQILSAAGDHSLPPTVAPVQISKPVQDCSSARYFTSVRASDADQISKVRSRTLLDLNHVAADSYRADRDRQIARAVARRVIKKGAIYAAKDQLNVSNGSGADLLLSLSGVVWEAVEKADTRHVQLLPERIDIAELTLPAGPHQLQITSSVAANQRPVANEAVDVRVDNGRNTFVLCFQSANGNICVVNTDH